MARPRSVKRPIGGTWKGGQRAAGNDTLGRMRSGRGDVIDDMRRHEFRYNRRLMQSIFTFLARENQVNFAKLVEHLQAQGFKLTREQAEKLVHEVENGK